MRGSTVFVVSIAFACTATPSRDAAKPTARSTAKPAEAAATTGSISGSARRAAGQPAPLEAGDPTCDEMGGIPNDRCCRETGFVDMKAAFAHAATHGARPFLFDNAVFSSGGRVRVMTGSVNEIGRGAKFGLMDLQGRLRAPFAWDYIAWFCDGQARACVGCTRDCLGHPECEHWSITGGEWVCIDGDGQQVSCAASK